MHVVETVKEVEIPKWQWAQVVEQLGGPVVYKQIPVLDPGPDEVLVNIRYSGVCHTDLSARKGEFPLEAKLPLVGGHEGAGVVVAKGQLVTNIRIGDHVGVKWLNSSCLSCEFCQNADEPLCPKARLSGYTVDGTFQQFCMAKGTHVSELPKDLPLDAVAPVLCAGITVYKALKESGARPGQWVAIVGAGGGLGSMAQQYAKAMALRVIAIDAGDEKRAMCMELGTEVGLDVGIRLIPEVSVNIHAVTDCVCVARNMWTSQKAVMSPKTCEQHHRAVSVHTPSSSSLGPRNPSSRQQAM